MSDAGADEPLLRVRGLHAGYGRRDVLFDVDVDVGEGEIVAVLGHNGAGKSTLLKSVLGLVTPTSGSIAFAGRDVTATAASVRIEAGMAYSPQQHFVFPDLTIAKNLAMGTYSRRRIGAPTSKDDVLGLFPVLSQRLGLRAGTLSGGQQRMLGLAMAMSSQPRLLVLDELSLGISPRLFDEILDVLQSWNAQHRTAVLLVEQHVDRVLDVARRGVVIRNGVVVADQPSERLLELENRWELF